MPDLIRTPGRHLQEMFIMISTREIRISAPTLSISIKMHSHPRPRVLRSGKIREILLSISLRDRALTGSIKDPQRLIFNGTNHPTSVTPFLTKTLGSEESRGLTDLFRISMMSGW